MAQSRRRLTGRFLLAAAWLYATCGSLYTFLMLIDPGVHWHDAPPGLRVALILFAILIAALNVLWLVLSGRDLFRGEGSQYLLSSTPEGTARISLRAIHSSLLRRARETPEVTRVKIAIRRPEKERIRVEATYATREDRNAIAVSETLRRALKERFEELVHPEEDLKVEYDVKLEGFTPATAGERPSAEPPREGEEPFTGPRYPID